MNNLFAKLPWDCSRFKFYFSLIGIALLQQKVHWDDLLVFVLPTVMYICGNSNIWVVIEVWLFILVLSSFVYSFVAINAGHHHTEIFHEGDELKSLDFGIYQLAATIDRNDVKDSLFLTLTNFGHHTLHHLFPTLDHGLLPQLNDILLITCKEFEQELREFPWWKLVVGQFQQLARTQPSKICE